LLLLLTSGNAIKPTRLIYRFVKVFGVVKLMVSGIKALGSQVYSKAPSG
jgi:hypothetical protein